MSGNIQNQKYDEIYYNANLWNDVLEGLKTPIEYFETSPFFNSKCLNTREDVDMDNLEDIKGELYYDFPTKIPDIRLFYVTLKQMKMNKNDQDKTIKIFYVLFGQIRVLPDLQSIVKSHLYNSMQYLYDAFSDIQEKIKVQDDDEAQISSSVTTESPESQYEHDIKKFITTMNIPTLQPKRFTSTILQDNLKERMNEKEQYLMLLKEGTKQETIHLNALEKDHVEGYDLNVPTLQMNANSSAEVMNNQNSMFHGSIDNNSSINTSQLMPSTLNPNGSVDTSTNMLDGISDLDSIRSNKVDFFDMNHPM